MKIIAKFKSDKITFELITKVGKYNVDDVITNVTVLEHLLSQPENTLTVHDHTSQSGTTILRDQAALDFMGLSPNQADQTLLSAILNSY